MNSNSFSKKERKAKKLFSEYYEKPYHLLIETDDDIYA